MGHLLRRWGKPLSILVGELLRSEFHDQRTDSLRNPLFYISKLLQMLLLVINYFVQEQGQAACKRPSTKPATLPTPFSEANNKAPKLQTGKPPPPRRTSHDTQCYYFLNDQCVGQHFPVHSQALPISPDKLPSGAPYITLVVPDGSTRGTLNSRCVYLTSVDARTHTAPDRQRSLRTKRKVLTGVPAVSTILPQTRGKR
ncbi:hypothetical protein AHAS_Ahas05G0054300 [Arachis hypogaea]